MLGRLRLLFAQDMILKVMQHAQVDILTPFQHYVVVVVVVAGSLRQEQKEVNMHMPKEAHTAQKT